MSKQELSSVVPDTRFLIPIKMLPTLSDIEIEVLGLAIQADPKMHKDKLGFVVARQTSLTIPEAMKILGNENFKHVLNTVRSRLRVGCPKPTDLATLAEADVLVEFSQRVANPETSDEYRVKYGEAILKYRAGLAKATVPLAAMAQDQDNKLDKETLDRLSNRINLKVVDTDNGGEKIPEDSILSSLTRKSQVKNSQSQAV